MTSIVTTEETEKQLSILREKGLQVFRSESMDHYKDFSTFTTNKVKHTDPVMGFSRLLEESFKTRQIRWLQEMLRKYPDKSHRFLTRIPDGFSDYNSLRDALLSIQTKAELTILHLPVANVEAPAGIIPYFERHPEVKGLTIDLAMPFSNLQSILRWAVERFQDIVLLNTDFEGNEEKFSLVFRLSSQYPNKFHLQGAYWNITSHNIQPLLATLAIAARFKSVSFKRAPIPAYMFSRIRGRPQRSFEKRIEDSAWIDDELMKYQNTHPTNCLCFGGIELNQMQRLVGVEACTCHHNLTSLARRFALMINDDTERRKILQLEIFQPTLVKLSNPW